MWSTRSTRSVAVFAIRRLAHEGQNRIVTGGGLAPHGDRWIPSRQKDLFGRTPGYGSSFDLPFSKEYLGTWIHTPSSCFGSLWMRTSVTSSVPFLSASQKSRS